MTISKEAIEARVHVDPATGIIRVSGEGFWAPDELSAIFDRLAAVVQLVHARRAAALVLVNLGDNGAQMKDTVERVQRRASSIYTAGDRLAVVVHSTLLKMQIARVEREAEYRVFGTELDAQAWLLSPADAPSAG